MKRGQFDNDEFLGAEVLRHPDEGGHVGVVDVHVGADAEEGVGPGDAEQRDVVILEDVSERGKRE